MKKELEALILEIRDLPELEKLEAVNRFFNERLIYSLDKGKDYWQTLEETLKRKAGDCDDFTIAKLKASLKAGVPKEKLNLAYATVNDEVHLALAYYPGPGADPLILDNKIDKILPLSMRRNFYIRFSFNHRDMKRIRQFREMEGRG